MSYYISSSSRHMSQYNSETEPINFHPALTFCPPKWASKLIVTMLSISAFVIITYVLQPLHTEINVLLIDQSEPPLFKTNERYLSVALDTSLIANNFEGFDMHNQKLRMMMQHLGGSYLRIGGTMADRLRFASRKAMHNTYINYEADGGNCVYENDLCRFYDHPNFTMSGTAWKTLNELAAQANLTILFDLNSLRRNKRGEWDAANAATLISFSNKHKFDLIWELGNEPNAYRHSFNYEVSGEQLANDFKALKSILNKYPRYKNALLVGPDVTNPRHINEEPRQYLHDFLSVMDSNILSAITFHQYYFKGENAQLSSFLNPVVFNTLEHEIWAIRIVTQQTYFASTPIWLGETSSAYGGGSATYSDKFAATFIWLDKLGLAAKNGISLVIRQSLFKGHYALLDENFNPNPDWWVSVVYKKLVGPEVIDYQLTGNPRVRLYCHCANKNNAYLNSPAIVVFGSNMNYTPAKVRIQSLNSDHQEKNDIKEFLLQTYASMVSKDIYLNNILLQVGSDGKLPRMDPKNLTSNIITIPPYTLGFWLVPVSAC